MTDTQLLVTIALAGSTVMFIGAGAAWLRARSRRDDNAAIYGFFTFLGLQGVCSGTATLVRPSQPLLAWILTGIAFISLLGWVVQLWRERRARRPSGARG